MHVMLLERKQILQKILKALVPYRDMANDFLVILEECNDEDEELINKLYLDITENIKIINSKDQIQKISKELRNIQEKELMGRKEEEQYVENLLSLIDG